MNLYLPWGYQTIQDMIFVLIRVGGYGSEKEILQMPIHDVKCRMEQINKAKESLIKK